MSALSSRFVSLFYTELESNGDVFYVNAGHPPAWLVGAEEVRRLDVGGTILGPIKAQTFRRGWAHLDPGDSLIIITDGLIERANSTGVMFEEEGIEAVARELRGRPAHEILDAIFAAAKNHGGTLAWEDDTTAVVVTRDPS
jgi:sigma-B regulation protein RsbU (phosphoserine phosphatase)